MTDHSPNIWAPAAEFPQEHDFYRDVLNALPTPVIVVDEAGNITYGNEAMSNLAGWSKAEATGTNLLGYIHPDDLAWVADLFLTLTTIPSTQRPSAEWAPVTVRIVAAGGDVIVAEVTGRERLAVEVVGGVIYHVRPVASQAIERSVVAGITTQRPTTDLLAEIVSTVALPPLDLEAAIVSVGASGMLEVHAATDPKLTEMLHGAQLSDDDLHDLDDPDAPRTFAATNIDGGLGEALAASGAVTCWALAIRCGDAVLPRLVATSGFHHTSDASIRERLTTAANLASIVFSMRPDDMSPIR